MAPSCLQSNIMLPSKRYFSLASNAVTNGIVLGFYEASEKFWMKFLYNDLRNCWSLVPLPYNSLGGNSMSWLLFFSMAGWAVFSFFLRISACFLNFFFKLMQLSNQSALTSDSLVIYLWKVVMAWEIISSSADVYSLMAAMRCRTLRTIFAFLSFQEASTLENSSMSVMLCWNYIMPIRG